MVYSYTMKGKEQIKIFLGEYKVGALDLGNAIIANRVIAVTGPRLGKYDEHIAGAATVLERGTTMKQGREVALTPAQKDRREEELASIMNRRHDAFGMVVAARNALRKS